MKNKSPEKIEKMDVQSIIIFRSLMIFLLLIAGTLNNIGGRYDPMSIILALMLLKV
jgi:hypothetical protein